MRKDFTLDNLAVRLPNASTFGFGLYTAKRGHWAYYRLFGEEADSPTAHGRVIGRVLCDEWPKSERVMVCNFGPQLDSLSVQWVRPQSVITCTAQAPLLLRESIVAKCDFNDLREVRKLMEPYLSLPLHFGTNNEGV